MSTTLSGPIVLTLSATLQTVEFEGQLWLDEGNVLTGKFHYLVLISNGV